MVLNKIWLLILNKDIDLYELNLDIVYFSGKQTQNLITVM